MLSYVCLTNRRSVRSEFGALSCCLPSLPPLALPAQRFLTGVSSPPCFVLGGKEMDRLYRRGQGCFLSSESNHICLLSSTEAFLGS